MHALLGNILKCNCNSVEFRIHPAQTEDNIYVRVWTFAPDSESDKEIQKHPYLTV